ncbi:MAG: BsuPI-related putative proteinase inhibitor [Candidatus Bathyarchaeia archaeon]
MEKEILVEAQTDKGKYSAGEEVKMSITVANKGQSPIELIFTSTQRYDFMVLKDGGEVWRWSNGKVFAMILESLPLKPGEKRTYTETWRPEDVAPGEYKVVGVVTSQPKYRATCKFVIW